MPGRPVGSGEPWKNPAPSKGSEFFGGRLVRQHETLGQDNSGPGNGQFKADGHIQKQARRSPVRVDRQPERAAGAGYV
jgi:hypothetical protein